MNEDFLTDLVGTGVFRTMKRMKMLPMLGVLGCLGLALPMTPAQSAPAEPAVAVEGRPVEAKRASGLPTISVRTQGEWTIGQLVDHLRAEVAKSRGGAQGVNILLGPGVAELKAPADLDLVNVTPLGVFAAIASVDPRLTFAPVSIPGSEMTITLQLRPNAKGQDSAKDIKVRVFRLPPPPKIQEADAGKARDLQAEALAKLNQNVADLMATAAGLRREAGGEGTSKGFHFQVHTSTRTVLVTGTAEDLDLAQEVLTALGATPSSSGRTEDPTSTKSTRAF